ncbi:MAG: hypothetical protein ACRERE_42815 [Candidatus Entotheonellia bacterium]
MSRQVDPGLLKRGRNNSPAIPAGDSVQPLLTTLTGMTDGTDISIKYDHKMSSNINDGLYRYARSRGRARRHIGWWEFSSRRIATLAQQHGLPTMDSWEEFPRAG